MDRLFYIHTKSMCEDDKDWFQDFRRTYQCKGCGGLRREKRQSPVDIVLAHRPNRSAINACHVGIGIIRADFLSLFDEELRRYFCIGRVLDRRRAEIDGFATFISTKPVPLRGGPNSARRYCDECGRFVYNWMFDEVEPYVVRESLAQQPIFGVERGRLLMTEELVDRIDRKRWKGIWIQEIPVRDTPSDGIEKFPENYF